jgi:hypothetical protein
LLSASKVEDIMSVIGQGNLTPIDWIGMLHGAVDPLKNKKEPHKYVAEEGDQLELSSSPNHKLTLEQIVEISRRAISTVNSQWQADKMETIDWADQINEICDLTEKLIDARVEKRKQNAHRKTVFKVSTLGALFLIGIPFLWMLKHNDNKFYSEISQLKRHLKEPMSGIIFYRPLADMNTTQTSPPPEAPPPEIKA